MIESEKKEKLVLYHHCLDENFIYPYISLMKFLFKPKKIMPLNDYLPIELTLLGTVIFVNYEHPLNTPIPFEFILFGINMCVICEHF